MAAKEKVFVVDDEPSIRKYLQTLLEVDGFDVEAVGTGREALAKVSGSGRAQRGDRCPTQGWRRRGPTSRRRMSRARRASRPGPAPR